MVEAHNPWEEMISKLHAAVLALEDMERKLLESESACGEVSARIQAAGASLDEAGEQLV